MVKSGCTLILQIVCICKNGCGSMNDMFTMANSGQIQLMDHMASLEHESKSLKIPFISKMKILSACNPFFGSSWINQQTKNLWCQVASGENRACELGGQVEDVQRRFSLQRRSVPLCSDAT